MSNKLFVVMNYEYPDGSCRFFETLENAKRHAEILVEGAFISDIKIYDLSKLKPLTAQIKLKFSDEV